jgi:DNA ligase-1
VPDWLFGESYALAGDLAETIALILPPGQPSATSTGLADTLAALSRLAGQPTEVRRAFVEAAWASLAPDARFLFTKLLDRRVPHGRQPGADDAGAGARDGPGRGAAGASPDGRLGPCRHRVCRPGGGPRAPGAGGRYARPYPFALASALEGGVEALGDAADWLAEWKWDGIRGQLVARPGAFALWSRGEELVTDRFPDLGPLRDALPAGTVLDGEVLAWEPGAARPLPFAALQTRIGRKTVPKSVLRAAPARFLAYDLLEAGGEDLRALPLATRRARLEALLSALPTGLPLAASPLLAPPLLEGADWDGLAALRAGARDLGAEGLMLKRAASPYAGGRRRGDWWKWKLDPFTVDAVMIYAQGRAWPAGRTLHRLHLCRPRR